MTSYVNFFLFFLFYDFFLNFWFFFGFIVLCTLITAVASLSSSSLLLFMFTHRWSTVHRTWGTVFRHVRVQSSTILLRGQLDGEVTDAAEVNRAALELDHLASWGTRWGPFGLVIKASFHRAPGSISQPWLLLQENLKWSYEKVNQ